MSIINCPICGVSFRANKQQKTCSMECRTKQTLARQLQRLEEFNKTDEQFCRFCNSMKKKIEFHSGICESYDPSSKMGWLLDHCHKSTKNRGILCLYCNSGIGYFRDNIEIMQKAIEYIRKYQ